MRMISGFILWFLRLPFKKNEMGGRGQVAIFAALIFQVLFVFFAMVVNVGLVVHHKINLQNSVDLAAYYGAMKQAEVMNAVAHVNYQIRQSWKLMVFHYRGLGMMGNKKPDAPFNAETGVMGANGTIDQAYSCPATFCSNFNTWAHMDPDEHYCRGVCDGQKITIPGQPFASSLLGGLLQASLPGITAAVDALSATARSNVVQRCKQAAAWNWVVLGRFIFSYKNDVQNRKRVLNKLANSISSSTDDLLDIDGNSVKTGVLQTLWKNMTYQNQASIDPKTGTGDGTFSMYNSLGAEGCNGTKDDDGIPPKWLSEIFVKPLYGFLDANCDIIGEAVEFLPKVINVAGDAGLPHHKELVDPAILNFLQQYINDPLSIDSAEAHLWHSTVGYEKNPWCTAYVKVSASTKPKIPFSPFSGVKISANAYAKPFGGKIGPWYYKTWPQSADSSQGGGQADQIDQAEPPRVKAGEQGVLDDDYNRIDHSRYVGDVIGAKSSLTMGHYQQAIYNKDGPKSGNRLNIAWWKHLMDGTADLNAVGTPGDILAWDDTKAPPIRSIEVEAIIPDQFDITNYSIEPDWWRTYAQRIQKRTDFSSLNIRGDLGFKRDGPAPWNIMSVKNQMELAHTDKSIDYESLSYYAGRNNDPVKAFTEVLTSWHNKVPGDYSIDPDRFGKCYDGGIIVGGPEDIERAVPGNCMAGGRTGYSVKIVDEEHLTSEQEIGGDGQTGKIKNLPPGF